MRPLVFIDVETTGLVHDFHEILEIAAVTVDPTTLEVESVWARKIKPLRIEDAAPRALEKNRYTPEAWEEAIDLAEALTELTPILRGSLVAGHNVGFDARFLLTAYQSFGWLCPMGIGSYHKLDTVSVAWMLMAVGRVSSLSLDSVCAELGISGAGSHSALPDALCSLEIARWARGAMLRGEAAA